MFEFTSFCYYITGYFMSRGKFSSHTVLESLTLAAVALELSGGDIFT